MKRLLRLDEIRGITLVSMILYHGIWDLVHLFGWNLPWYRLLPGYVWQQSICWTFILLSGFCWSLGHHRYKRGVTVFAAGALVTAVTCFVMPASRVVFGVLTLLGSCMLLCIPFRKLLEKCPSVPGGAVSFSLFLFLRNVNRGSLGFEKWKLLPLPEKWYHSPATAYLGFPPEDFFSTDYFSLIPWMFLFLTGYFLYRFCLEKGQLIHLEGGKLPLMQWLGRHSLILYLLHQPMLYLLLYLLVGSG